MIATSSVSESTNTRKPFSTASSCIAASSGVIGLMKCVSVRTICFSALGRRILLVAARHSAPLLHVGKLVFELDQLASQPIDGLVDRRVHVG